MESTTLSPVLDRVRAARPLIHHITNIVTINDCANITLAAGGSPVMAEAPEEVVEMASMADALVLNIGTLSASQVDSMLLAGRAANDQNCPVVLDPVGAGATICGARWALGRPCATPGGRWDDHVRRSVD